MFRFFLFLNAPNSQIVLTVNLAHSVFGKSLPKINNFQRDTLYNEIRHSFHGFQLNVNVVKQIATYSIPCNDCDNEYIGQTKPQFGKCQKEHQKSVFFCKIENSALLEHTCLTNHTIGWDKSKIMTTNRRYHQHLYLEARHINSAHAPLNLNDGGSLPDAYLHLVRKKAAKQCA